MQRGARSVLLSAPRECPGWIFLLRFPSTMSAPHLFSRAEADRVLRRAAEIEGTGEERPISLAELRSIGTEAGFAPQTLERAVADVQNASRVVSRSPVRRSGVIIAHLSAVRELPVGIDAEQLIRVVRLCQPYRDGPADVRLEDSEITWVDRKGLRMAVTSVGGITEVRVYVSGFLLRRGRWRSWVQAAVDHLEALVSLVATQHPVPRVQLAPAPPAGAPSGGQLPAPPASPP